MPRDSREAIGRSDRHGLYHMDIAMSSLPAWARLSIITAGVLFSPVFAVLMTLVVAILLGLLMEVRVPAPFALVIAGAIGWFLFRKLWPRPPGSTPVKNEAGDRASAKLLAWDVSRRVAARPGSRRRVQRH